MDRNYFLSYSHKIALLLLLVAVGKLNAKFIPVTMSKNVLPYCADIQTQRCLAGTSVRHWADGSVLHQSADQNSANSLYIGSQHNFSNDIYIRILFLKDIRTVVNNYNLIYSYLFHKGNTFFTFKKAAKFHINSVKLIDGFKFIIKIPDKLVSTLKH
ncbi:hypothetical protein ACR1PO_06040 [Chryseobacterium sp. RRHN12]|uniref:hypothetical protein n=1 Tax=Chryseobacterium sp. RRHN12 TaxID=3437884 RepID=UPI002FCB0B2E